jgi:hypothetical protein
MEFKQEKYTILKYSWDKNGVTALTAKQAERGLGTIVSVRFFQENVWSIVSPRNVLLQVFAISLFLYITCKSVRELFLVTNCIYCVLSVSGPSIDPCGTGCLISPQFEFEFGRLLSRITFWYIPSR